MEEPTAGLVSAYVERARELVRDMTLEEKASLCSGRDFWSTKAIERLGLESICLTDGPHGVRKAADTDFTQSLPATCFPTASALGASWDEALLGEVGEALGKEARALGVQILLGPGINMKRSPLSGRNFEYFSEDPLLSGRLAAAHVRGVQSQGVGACLKHFAANNQEHERTTTSSNLDERTLHEIYLTAFEIAVREAQPWAVMSAYNRVNGTFASEHPYLLTEVLRERWGHPGLVVSDWGAVNDRVASVKAGLHLEMPASLGKNDRRVVEAVQSGELSVEQLDELVVRLVSVTLCALAGRDAAARFDVEAHHALARRVAAESMVLLKNDGFLPFDPERPRSIAVLGAFAEAPRYQGAGSSQVRPTRLESALDALRTSAPNWYLNYAPVYDEDGGADDARLAAAARMARAADAALVFVGLPDSYESEGFDRRHLDLPRGHERLIEAVADAQSNFAVVLMNGAPVRMPWARRPRAIVEAWLGGQAGGGAIAQVLTGAVNPSGKLAETFPARLEDTPAFLDFPGQDGEARYGERVFVGYRAYDQRQLEPLFPFGHGLSYTRFDYGSLELLDPSPEQAARGVLFVARVGLKNVGGRAGKEVVQLYIGERKPRLPRPPKELKHFAKVLLEPGEAKKLDFELCARDFAYYDARVRDWVVDAGTFDVYAGGSSRGALLHASVHVEVPRPYPPLDERSTLKDFAEHPRGRAHYRPLLDELVAVLTGGADPARETPEQRKARTMAEAFFSELPLWRIPLLTQGKIDEARIAALLGAASGEPSAALNPT